MAHLRLAVRALRTFPAISIVTILSLALGIGVTTSIFALVNGLLLRPLPVHHPERLVLVSDASARNLRAYSYSVWEALRQADVFDGMVSWASTRFDMRDGGEAQFAEGVWVSGSFFDVSGVAMQAGRSISEVDARRGGGPDGLVVVISDGFWRRYYGGAADAIGRTIRLDRVPFTIVGITPPGFFGLEVGRSFDVAVPIGAEPLVRGRDSLVDRGGFPWLNVLGRLKPGESMDTAQEALGAAQRRIREATVPANYPPAARERYLNEQFTLLSAANGHSGLRGRYERPLVTILVVVSILLLVACANAASLLAARAMERGYDTSVRRALGASRARLIGEWMTESALLAAASAVLGLLIAAWGSRALVAQLSTPASRVFLDVSLDWRVLGFALAVTVATALICGVVPALPSSAAPSALLLRGKGRMTTGTRDVGILNALVIAQVALSLVLVFGAGLFVQTFASLATRPLGFDRENVLLVSVSAVHANLEASRRVLLYEQVRESIASVPGVAAVGMSLVTPVSGRAVGGRVEVSGGVRLPETESGSDTNYVSPGWFSALGMPIIAGRGFTSSDVDGAPLVAVVNEAFVRKFFEAESPIGQTLTAPTPHGRMGMEIVGLVGDAVYRSVRDPVPPTFYVPFAQSLEAPQPSVNLTIRSASGSPASLTHAATEAIRSVDPDLTISYRLLAEQVGASLSQERIVAGLSASVGAVALLMAAVGFYGMVSFAARRRRGELAVRLALGALPASVIRLVLRRLAVLTVIGVALGCGLAVWASKYVATLLYGLGRRDPTTFVATALMLAAVGALAGGLPAYRASRMDVAAILKEDA